VRDPEGVPLTLVTGPANAEKARVVLDGYRAAAVRAPLLVVPTFADVARYRAELAESGLVFGTAILRFRHLAGEMARRAGVRGRGLTRLQRERVAAAAIASVPLQVLRRSAATPGFAAALVRLASELEQARVDPPRFTSALRTWAAGTSRAAYAEELAALYAAYRGALERMGRRDDDLRLAAAIDGLRAEPGRWGARPVFVYGFDDLRPLQREAIAVLAATGAEVTVSLTFEAGRYAFAGRTETIEALRPLADRVIELPAIADHYASPALHHVERRLFEPPEDGALFDAGAPQLDPDRPAISLMEGGGERAELELVAAEVARMIREDGIAPEEIAVVARDVRAVAPQLRRVFAAAGVPVALERHLVFGHTPLGAGLVALLRCALLDGTAEDLLTWLRTPGLLQEPALADRLEADARQEGARTAAAARELWERERWPLDAIDRVAAAHERGPKALMETLSAELAARFAAPYARQAAILDGAQAADARVLAAGRRALGDLADLAEADPGLAPAPAELARLLEELDVGLRDEPRAGAVAVSDPLSLRARRVRALVLCGMQENRFPRPATPEPFLGDAERRELAAATGLVLRRHEDTLDAERYLLYATVSRPEERLVLSWHGASDDGDPAVRSLFVDDVASLFGTQLWDRRARRGLGEVGWEQAPSEPERRRGAAVAGPRHREAPPAPLRHPEVLAAIRARPAWSVSDVEAWAGCPVKWLVERRLRLAPLVPDDEHLLRGSAAHAALERALRRLVRENGTRALSPERLPEAREAVAEALEQLAGRIRLSTDPRRVRALARRLEFDLQRYVEHAACAGSAFVPSHFEVSFGGEGDEHGPLRLSADVAVAGRIDRIDVRGRSAMVYDYKGRTTTDGAHWVQDRKWQVALYLIAVKELLDLEPAGGLYQPLGSKDLRPRGALLADADPELDVVRNDRREPEDLEALVDAVVDEVLRAVAELRSGALQPRPATCAYGGGCSYPMICRSDA
jgi:ATP-dependent helicase/DNAse subunit B